MAKRQSTRKKRSTTIESTPSVTFLEHIRELQGRLFMVALAFLAIAGTAYPFFDKIVNIIVAPLGKQQELVYLTPGGAFSFIIQVCLYVGIIGALPVIIYQVYRFVMPAVQRVKLRRALGFTISSFLLAAAGIVFAYVVSLPAALYFLTSFNLYHINPMLTIDSYFSFVMTYLLAGALLFQLPLVMLVIDSVKPLTPKKLMDKQRHIIVGSFVVAAVISPTPDAMNQMLLASPMVIMYQLGIMIIWLRRRKERRLARRTAAVRPASAGVTPVIAVAQQPATPALRPQVRPAAQASLRTLPPRSAPATTPAVGVTPETHRQPVRTLDGFVVSNTSRSQPRKLVIATRAQTGAQMRHSMTTARPTQVRSLDGFRIVAG